MKRLALTISLLSLILSGCDAPSGGRARSRSLASTAANSFSSAGTNFNPQPTPTGTATSGTNLGAGYENCDLTAWKNTGAFSLAICQSTIDETKIKVKFQNTDTSNMTCMVPTYKGQDGSSIYIGQAQCTFHQAGQVLDGTFVKNRPGYSQAILNGTMIMKQARLQGYFDCMNAVSDYVGHNCPANPNFCMTAAISYRDNICAIFVQQGNYLDLKLRN